MASRALLAGTRFSEAANALGGRLLHRLAGYFRSHSTLGGSTFFDTAKFLWIERLEASWPLIRHELDTVLRYREALPNFQDLIAHERHLSDDAGWKTYFFTGYGLDFRENMARCPETSRLIGTIPGMTSAMFSILAPGKRIPPHRGPYAGVLRYHLGLRVPARARDCAIRVGDEVRHWEEGKSLVFDDVYEHEVWNETEETRVVLFVDFKRPMGGLARMLNEVVIRLIARSPYVRDAAARHGLWEARLTEAAARFG